MVAVTPEKRVATVDRLMRLAAECFCAPRIVFTPKITGQLQYIRWKYQPLTDPDENWDESFNMFKTRSNADRKVVDIPPYGRTFNIVYKISVRYTTDRGQQKIVRYHRISSNNLPKTTAIVSS